MLETVSKQQTVFHQFQLSMELTDSCTSIQGHDAATIIEPALHQENLDSLVNSAVRFKLVAFYKLHGLFVLTKTPKTTY